MAIFASRRVNVDPEPWRNPAANRRSSERVHGGWWFDPRPEFDNVVNPILVEFRELHADTGNDLLTDAYLFSSGLMEDFERYDLAHWTHAMDVLNRIVRLKKLAAIA